MKQATSKGTPRGLTKDQRAELDALAALPDEGIDTADIPEVLDWSDARRGVFYRPVKQQLTLRLDADVVTWFKRRARGGRGYQTDINRALREHVRHREMRGVHGFSDLTTCAQLIQQSEVLIQSLDQRIDGLEIPTDLRSRLAAGCLDAALEHQKAIVLLAAKQLHGSAFSLIRVIFEAYIRGIWLHQCATETDIENFMNGKVPTISKLLTAIEKKDGFESGVLSNAQRQSWKAMNGFVHSGFDQVVRRHTETTIEPNYGEEEILAAINFANAIGCLAAIAICSISNNNELAMYVLEKARELI